MKFQIKKKRLNMFSGQRSPYAVDHRIIRSDVNIETAMTPPQSYDQIVRQSTSARDEARHLNQNAAMRPGSPQRQIKRIMTNILGGGSPSTQTIIREETNQHQQPISTHDPSNSEVKRMLKVFSNMYSFGVEVYLLVPLFLSHSFSQDEDKMIPIFCINAVIDVCIRYSFIYFMLFILYFTIVNYAMVQSQTADRLRAYRRQFTSSNEIAEDFLLRASCYFRNYFSQQIRKRNRASLKVPTININQVSTRQSFKDKHRNGLQISAQNANSSESQNMGSSFRNEARMDVEEKAGDKIVTIGNSNQQKSSQSASSHLSQQREPKRLYFSFGDHTEGYHFDYNESGRLSSINGDSSKRIQKATSLKQKLDKQATRLLEQTTTNRDYQGQNLNQTVSQLLDRSIGQKGDFEIYSSSAIQQIKSESNNYSSPSIRQLGMGLSPYLGHSAQILSDKITERNEDDISQTSLAQQTLPQDNIFMFGDEKYRIKINNKEESKRGKLKYDGTDEEVKEDFFSQTRPHSFSKTYSRVQLKDLQKFCSPDVQDNKKFLMPQAVPRMSHQSPPKDFSQFSKQSSINSAQNLQSRRQSFQEQQTRSRQNSQVSQDSARSRSSALSSSPSFTVNSVIHDQFENPLMNRQLPIDLRICQQQSSKKDGKRIQFTRDDIESFALALNTFGFLYLFGVLLLLIMMRKEFLSSIFLFQFCIYVFIYYLTNQLVYGRRIKYTFYIILFVTMQYPSTFTIDYLTKFLHVIMNLMFLIQVCYQQNHDTFKQDLLHKKINQILQSDNHLKNLVQLIPYGIAVLNLDDVSHFNHPFGQVLGIERQKDIDKALLRFQRKIKLEDKTHFDRYKTNENPSKKVKYSSLKEDLRFILNNKEMAFAETNNIFDIYFLEKEGEKGSQARLDNFNKESSASINLGGKYNPSQDSHNSQVTQARKFYSISISPINWKDKECLLLTVKDITHEKIVDQKKVLERLKNMIFKSFSHELKTPLNGIIMSLETSHFISKKVASVLEKERMRGQVQLQDAMMSSKQLRTQLKIMESCAFVLKNIMSDFFDYNQLQSNELSLNIKEFDLNECIKHVQKVIQHQIQFDKVQFKCKIEYQNPGGFSMAQNISTENIRMISDKERLQQILLNLLMNAIKFTTKGMIELEVFVKQLSIPQCVKFKVKDTGIGIEESRLPYIFNLFEKNENSNIQQYLNTQKKSARMGLPISQNLCQLMGGHIFVKSRVNAGTTFSFALPLKLDENLGSGSKPLDNITTPGLLLLPSDNSSLTRRTIEMAPLTPSEAPSKFKFSNEESKSEVDNVHSLDHRRDNERLHAIAKDPTKKKSSKDFFWNQNQKVGGFEIVFKSPNSKDHNFKFFLNPNINDEPEESAPTPKLMHSSTQVEAIAKNLDQLPLNLGQQKFRKMRTSLIQVNGQQQQQEQSQSPLPSPDKERVIHKDSQASVSLIVQQSEQRKQETYLSPDDYQLNQQNSNFSFQNYMNSNKKVQPILAKDTVTMMSNSSHRKKEQKPQQLSQGYYLSSGEEGLLESIESVSDISTHNNHGSKLISPQKKRSSLQEEIKDSSLTIQNTDNNNEQLKNQKISYAALVMQKRNKRNSNHQIEARMITKHNSHNLMDSEEARAVLAQDDDCVIDSERPKFVNYIPEQRNIEAHPGRELFDTKIKFSQTMIQILPQSGFINQTDPDQNENIVVPIQPSRSQSMDITQRKPAQQQRSHKSLQREQQFKTIKQELSVMLRRQTPNLKPNQEEMSSPALSIFTITANQQQQQLDKNEEIKVESFDQQQLQPNKINVIRKHTNISFNASGLMMDSQQSSDMKKLGKFESKLHKDSWQFLDTNQNEEVKQSANKLLHSQTHEKGLQQSRDKKKKSPKAFGYWPTSSNDTYQSEKALVPSAMRSFGNNKQNLGQIRTDMNDGNVEQQNLTSSQNNGYYASPIPQKLSQNFYNPQGFLNIKTDLSNGLSQVDDLLSQHVCPTIMVVDDVQINRYAIEQMLTLMFGINVLQAENGKDCIDKLREYFANKKCQCQGIRLIFMDLEMPIMGGLQAASKLRSLMTTGQMPDIPIIALTAYHDERDNCITVGMKDFMVKPATKAQLEEVLVKFKII